MVKALMSALAAGGFTYLLLFVVIPKISQTVYDRRVADVQERLRALGQVVHTSVSAAAPQTVTPLQILIMFAPPLIVALLVFVLVLRTAR